MNWAFQCTVSTRNFVFEAGFARIALRTSVYYLTAFARTTATTPFETQLSALLRKYPKLVSFLPRCLSRLAKASDTAAMPYSSDSTCRSRLKLVFSPGMIAESGTLHEILDNNQVSCLVEADFALTNSICDWVRVPELLVDLLRGFLRGARKPSL